MLQASMSIDGGLEITLSTGTERTIELETSLGPSCLFASLSIDDDPALRLGTDADLDITLISDAVHIHSGDEYAGPYDVTPTLDGFELATRDLTMTSDVKVEPIPVSSASNPQGGYTVVIG